MVLNQRNTRQCFEASGITSNVKKITCRVPLGSCIDPQLFLIFIKDLPCALKCSRVTMLADGTSLAYSSKVIKDIVGVINS